MPFKFREDISIADVAFEATGKTLNELFEACATAIVATMVKNYKKIAKKQVKKFTAYSKGNVEKLLHDFMNELIFIKDAEKLLFGKCKVNVVQRDGAYALEAECYGEKINPKKHILLVDVKAATWHMFKVEETDKGWKALVILDV